MRGSASSTSPGPGHVESQSLLLGARRGSIEGSSRQLVCCFLTLVCLYFLINADHGAVPAALGPIASELGMGFFEQGVLGAAPYIGLIIASLVTSQALSHAPRAAIALSLFGECAFLCLVALTRFAPGTDGSPQRWPLLLSRFGAGACQGVVAIYVPVWIDEFAPTASRARWMACVQAAVPLGIMAGYLSTGAALARLGPSAWWLVFVLQAALLLPLVVAVLVVPREFLTIDLVGSASPRREGAPIRDAPKKAPGDRGGGSQRPIVFADERRGGVDNVAYEPPSTRAHLVSDGVGGGSIGGDGGGGSSNGGSGSNVGGGGGGGGGGSGEFSDCDTDSNAGGEGLFGSASRIAALEWADLMPSAGARDLGHGLGQPLLLPRIGSDVNLRLHAAEGGLGSGGLGNGDVGAESSVSERAPRSAQSNPQMAKIAQLEELGPGWSEVGRLLRTPVYAPALLGLSALFFVVNGVQFWATQYLLEVCGADPLTALSAYAATSATAPVLGVLTGGACVDRLADHRQRTLDAAAARKAATATRSTAAAAASTVAGAYTGADPVGRRRTGPSESARRAARAAVTRHTRVLVSMRVAVAFAVAAVAAAPCACLFMRWQVVVSLLWTVLFCGGATLAPVTGAMLAVAPRELRPLASALSTLTSNLLGYALSSFLSGCVMEMVPGNRTRQLRVGFTLVLGWSAVAFACFIVGLGQAQRAHPGAAAAVGRVMAERRVSKAGQARV